jgi:TRAP-type C4-dicarboxylate transport system permease small subunit
VSSKPGLATPPGWLAALRVISRGLGYFAAGLLVVSVFVICHMVFVRAVLNESSIWQTEFVTYAVIAATFLGAPYIQMTRGHVNVDIVPLLAGRAGRKWLSVSGNLIALAFCGFFLYAAIPWWHEVFVTGETTASMWRARLWIPYLSVPVGLGVLCLQIAADIWQVLTDREEPFGMEGSAS